MARDRGLRDAAGGWPNEYEADRQLWADDVACCLAHRSEVFWHHQFGEWVHTSCFACEALAGWAGPDPYRCRYCGVVVQFDGGDRAWEFRPDGVGEWVQRDGRWVWLDNKWAQDCPVSPTYHHETTPLGLTRVKVTH